MDLAGVGEVTFTSADRVRGVVHNFYADGKKLDAAVAVIAACTTTTRCCANTWTATPANSTIWTNAGLTAQAGAPHRLLLTSGS
ncbi:hypothetical protein [Streptomyces sp. 769]|uniref:hypothetical protein n=1 Tax=Streptomyces sp. 769 TaxID=1262452 RepID=UPI00057D22AC|nr:hypothetical protein [Streptomyces sp. 769]AJC54283.1 hypothetical protein GZL_01687 [Streptomyces sp. 769]